MSYAIIRNTKYKRENLKGIFRHNERRNKNYSNENIDKEKSYLNYSIRSNLSFKSAFFSIKFLTSKSLIVSKNFIYSLCFLLDTLSIS